MSSGYIVPPPPAFNINDKNVGPRFVEYKSRFSLFMKANGFDNKEEGQKVAILKSLCGDDLAHQIEARESENETFVEIFQRLEDYFSPKSNSLENKFSFFTRRQFPWENFDKYLIELKKAAKTCNFGESEEELLKIVLIMNVKDNVQQKVFLKIGEEQTLDNLIPEFRKYDDSTKDANASKKDTKKTPSQTQNGHDSGKKEPPKKPNPPKSNPQNPPPGPKSNPQNPPPGPKKENKNTAQPNSQSAKQGSEKKSAPEPNNAQSASQKKKKNKNKAQLPQQPSQSTSDIDVIAERVRKLNEEH